MLFLQKFLRRNQFLLSVVLTLSVIAPFSIADADSSLENVMVNFHRHSDTIVTGGEIDLATAPALFKKQGFQVVLDLRTAQEGTTEEELAVLNSGLQYRNIPMSAGLPTDEEVSYFIQLVEDSENLPMVIHCRSGNRVGTLWAAYKVSDGESLETAIAEGKAMGMSESNAELLRQQVEATQ